MICVPLEIFIEVKFELPRKFQWKVSAAAILLRLW